VGGYSGSGANAVTSATDRLGVYRLTQRLAYLGFPNQDGSALEPTDELESPLAGGTVAGEAQWAVGLFNRVVSDTSSNDNSLVPANTLTATGLQFIISTPRAG
jgi:hypothetical protein